MALARVEVGSDPGWVVVVVVGLLPPLSKDVAATGVAIGGRALPAQAASRGARRSPVAAARARPPRTGAAGAGVSARTATIAGDGSGQTPGERRYCNPRAALAPSRAIISVTRGENSIPTKNAVAIQIASLTSVTALP